MIPAPHSHSLSKLVLKDANGYLRDTIVMITRKRNVPKADVSMPPRISVPSMSDKSPGFISPFETAFASCGVEGSVPTAAFIRFAACANLRSCMMTCQRRLRRLPYLEATCVQVEHAHLARQANDQIQ